tara:strand:+ start:488 stop:1135 length:648 start_codon:yes stop_codon:yes gene_type:complete
MNIAMTCYNRYSYLLRSIKSLFKSNFDEPTNLYLFDDNSEDPKVKKLLDSLGHKDNLKVNITYNKKNIGCDPNMLLSIKEAFKNTEDNFVITTDSDAIYNPEWYNNLKKRTLEVKESIAGVSTFNTPSHPIIKEYNQYLVEKQSLGGFALAISRDLFDQIPSNQPSWDWTFTKIAQQQKLKMLCTKDSYADHIGVHGVHSTGQDEGDKAQNFIGE